MTEACETIRMCCFISLITTVHVYLRQACGGAGLMSGLLLSTITQFYRNVMLKRQLLAYYLSCISIPHTPHPLALCFFIFGPSKVQISHKSFRCTGVSKPRVFRTLYGYIPYSMLSVSRHETRYTLARFFKRPKVTKT